MILVFFCACGHKVYLASSFVEAIQQCKQPYEVVCDKCETRIGFITPLE